MTKLTRNIPPVPGIGEIGYIPTCFGNGNVGIYRPQVVSRQQVNRDTVAMALLGKPQETVVDLLHLTYIKQQSKSAVAQ
jgi:hypothetical protein